MAHPPHLGDRVHDEAIQGGPAGGGSWTAHSTESTLRCEWEGGEMPGREGA